MGPVEQAVVMPDSDYGDTLPCWGFFRAKRCSRSWPARRSGNQRQHPPDRLRIETIGGLQDAVARPTGNGLLFYTNVWFTRGLHPHANMAVVSQGCQAAPYCRRHPEHTILYQIIQQHLETYLRLAREDDWDGARARLRGTGISPLPRMRPPGLRLRPGPLSPIVLTRGGHDFPVAFSCKGRAVCPSCNARRMAETAAHLVDHVIPPLPVRQ